jgi:hypothetical protein
MFSGDQSRQCWAINQRFKYLLGLHHQGRYNEWPYDALIYTSLSNQCLLLLVYYAAGGRSQTARSPIRFLIVHLIFSSASALLIAPENFSTFWISVSWYAFTFILCEFHYKPGSVLDFKFIKIYMEGIQQFLRLSFYDIILDTELDLPCFIVLVLYQSSTSLLHLASQPLT